MLRFDPVEICSFSVESGTIGFASDVLVFLLSSDALTGPLLVSLKLVLKLEKEIEPLEK